MVRCGGPRSAALWLPVGVRPSGGGRRADVRGPRRRSSTSGNRVRHHACRGGGGAGGARRAAAAHGGGGGAPGAGRQRGDGTGDGAAGRFPMRQCRRRPLAQGRQRASGEGEVPPAALDPQVHPRVRGPRHRSEQVERGPGGDGDVVEVGDLSRERGPGRRDPPGQRRRRVPAARRALVDDAPGAVDDARVARAGQGDQAGQRGHGPVDTRPAVRPRTDGPRRRVGPRARRGHGPARGRDCTPLDHAALPAAPRRGDHRGCAKVVQDSV